MENVDLKIVNLYNVLLFCLAIPIREMCANITVTIFKSFRKDLCHIFSSKVRSK